MITIRQPYLSTKKLHETIEKLGYKPTTTFWEALTINTDTKTFNGQMKRYFEVNGYYPVRDITDEEIKELKNLDKKGNEKWN